MNATGARSRGLQSNVLLNELQLVSRASTQWFSSCKYQCCYQCKYECAQVPSSSVQVYCVEVEVVVGGDGARTGASTQFRP